MIWVGPRVLRNKGGAGFQLSRPVIGFSCVDRLPRFSPFEARARAVLCGPVAPRGSYGRLWIRAAFRGCCGRDPRFLPPPHNSHPPLPLAGVTAVARGCAAVPPVLCVSPHRREQLTVR